MQDGSGSNNHGGKSRHCYRIVTKMNRAGEKNALHRLGGLAIAASLLPGVVGLATEFWLSDNVSSRHLGLWKTCRGIASCGSLSADEWFTTVQGLCVMALCLHAISVVTGCCCGCLGSHSLTAFSFFPRLEEGAAVIAGLLMGVSLAVFACSTQSHPVFSNFHLDWSFWLCFAQVCLLLVFGGVVALTRDDCACQKRCSRKRKIRNKSQQRQNVTEHPTKRQEWESDELICDPVKEKDPMIFNETPFKISPAVESGLIARSSSEDPPKYFSSHEGLPHLFRSLSSSTYNDISIHVV